MFKNFKYFRILEDFFSKKFQKLHFRNDKKNFTNFRVKIIPKLQTKKIRLIFFFKEETNV